MAGDGRSKALLFAAGTLAASTLVIVLGGRWMETVIDLESSPMQPLPAPDIVSDYLSGVAWATLLTAIVFVWGTVVQLRKPLLQVWSAKLAIGLCLILFFDFNYGVDPDGYFVNASSPGFAWHSFEIGQGTANIQLLTWLHYRLLSTSFTASRLTFSFLGLVAVYLVYRAATIMTGRQDRRIFYAFGLMPSVLFWSSILGKDPVVFLGIAAYTYGVVAVHTNGRMRDLTWVALGIAISMYVRTWLGPILLLPLAVLGWAPSQGFARRAAFGILVVLGLVSSPFILQTTIGVDRMRQEDLLEAANSSSRNFVKGGSTQEVPDIGTVGGLASFVPFGVFTALFRPLPGEVGNAFGFLAGLENLLILCLALRAVWRTRLRDLNETIVAWALITVLFWAISYSIGSFQNLGSLSRYRLQITPVFLGLLFYLGRRRDLAPAGQLSRSFRIRRNPIVQAGT